MTFRRAFGRTPVSRRAHRAFGRTPVSRRAIGLVLALFGALGLGPAPAAQAAVLTILDGTSSARSFFYFQDGSSNYFPAMGLYGIAGDYQADVFSDHGLGAHITNTLTVANPALGTFGSAGPASGAAMGAFGAGGALAPLVQTGASVPINIATAATTQLVAAVSAKAIYVTAWDAVAGGTTNFTLEYGTQTTAPCDTGTTALTGAYGLIAQFGVAKGSGLGSVLVVPAGNALCAVNSAAVQVSGSVAYSQF
jgi:hypothetical protein